MKLLLLTLMYDDKKTIEYKTKTINDLDLPVAANVFQKNCVQGLKENGVEEISGLNSLPVGTWPKQYKEMYMKDDISNINGLDCYSTRTINIVGIKQLTRTISAYSFLKKVIKENPDQIILTYNFYLPYYSALVLLKCTGHRYKLCTLVTDLPNEFGIVTETGIRRILSNIIGKLTMKMTGVSDAFVLLTEQMKEPLRVGNRPYIVVEGFANNPDEIVAKPNTRIKNVVYTGTMSEKFGVGNLISEFMSIDDNTLELHLYGAGDMVPTIMEATQKDQRIKYFGSVTRDEAVVAQKNATLLINPRDGKDSYTKYSFPSKTMEYLASGRPVLGYMLPGIPAEYGEFLIPIGDEGIAMAIKTCLNLSNEQLTEIGARGKQFVLSKKNYLSQTKKIINLLESI